MIVCACPGHVNKYESEVNGRMEVLRQEEIHTIEDIYALPDGERAELIDGRIYYMAPPSTKHQRQLPMKHF